MTAIDPEMLENLRLAEELKRLKSGGFVTAEHVVHAKATLELPKTNSNILARIAFFLLGCFLFSSLGGLSSLVLLNLMDIFGSHYEIMLFFYAAIGFGMAELLAAKYYYAYGLDDAFVIGCQLLFATGVGVMLDSATAGFLALGVVGLLTYIRYVLAASALFGVIGISGFFASLVISDGVLSNGFLPFLMLLVSVALFFGSRKLSGTERYMLYENGLGVVKACSLILAYLSVNYLVVRQLSESLMNVVVAPGEDIPLAILFYGFTFLIPAFYLVYAIKAKDRMFFIVGLLAVAFTVFTIRYYHSVLPIEMALTIGGSLLFGVSYFFIRKIRNNDTGITFKPDRYTDSEALSYAQAVIANSHAHMKNVMPNDSPMPFGGGGFSGGGAGENY
ncbi:hypothetical protein FLLO111716_03165 [Flavobacterium longum]|uniref:hypothetical protein n=1 Tax=Flavobacterium longum TaxID=1299340 RepID=UPI0039E89C1E